MQDVGKPKAVVAAERVNARVAGANVTPHHARIEDMGPDFYSQFTVIILGLDSLEARRWMNSMACSLLGEPPSTADRSRLFGVLGGTGALSCHRSLTDEPRLDASTAPPPPSASLPLLVEPRLERRTHGPAPRATPTATPTSTPTAPNADPNPPNRQPPEYDEDGSPDVSTIKPMVDGGTEGFKGHARRGSPVGWGGG
jgi:molybdopterin/thiamine biosynthesis adenylyltransferase